MNKLEKAKEIIKRYYNEAKCGIFNSRNVVGDYMEPLYESSDITIDICRSYEYFEVFGLSEEEFSELEKFYTDLDVSTYNSQRLDKAIRDKFKELEESIETRDCNRPYTMEEKYNFCVRLKQILDIVMD